MQAMLAVFLQTNIKNSAIQSVQVDQIVQGPSAHNSVELVGSFVGI